MLKIASTGMVSMAGTSSIAEATSCIQCNNGFNNEKEWDDCAYARDWSACTLDNFPEYEGWSKEAAAKRENVCKFGREVVFPVLTAASLADGVPLDEVVVAKGWAAFSAGCYVIEKLDDYHAKNVESVALYTQGSSAEDYASSGFGSSRSLLTPKQIV